MVNRNVRHNSANSIAPRRACDYEDKRRDYARAGISEYWIVDPLENQVTVLVLQDSNYTEHGVFRIGDVASGVLLPALSIDVRAMLSVA